MLLHSRWTTVGMSRLLDIGQDLCQVMVYDSGCPISGLPLVGGRGGVMFL